MKSALTGCIVLLATLAFGQNPSLMVEERTQDQDPVLVDASNNKSTALALGENTSATGNYSIAIGNGASADMDNTMVLGGISDEDRVSVGIGTSNPNSLSSLDLSDIDKGLLVNRLSNQQVEMFEMALGIADEGMMIYNTSTHALQTWNGLNWDNIQPKQLALKEHQLKINDGPSVDLSDYQQDLTRASLNGMKLKIEIENGDDVTVDLSPLFREYEERLAALEKLLIGKEESQDESNNVRTVEDVVISNEAELSQNAPNPFKISSTVNYVIPEGTESAYIVILDTGGKVMSTQTLNPVFGSGEKQIQSNGMAPGVYYLSLYIDRLKVETITMVIQ